MFSRLLKFVKGLPHAVLPNPDWKKLAWAAGLGVASFFVVGYLLPAVLSLKVIALGAAGAVAYVVYTRVAMWEIERALRIAKSEVDEVKDLVK